ncbi:hypothetical protein [Frigoribacterium sp. CG_9.8]|uniref:hypothetical protein n=1 Tax=Frigoribacterium sp. CG_9.8 TaxID=2787733 RepID=UPI0018C9B730|nr:hypothetical protein [Frigoribacterium sp. CG_9.8]MBG6106564.1 hypothetical protein [Frigoribacterium sp. CG_9.8]
MTSDQDTPQVGDYVTLVESPGALTWKITAIHENASANGALYTLESGQTGRKRYELADNFTSYRRITG